MDHTKEFQQVASVSEQNKKMVFWATLCLSLLIHLWMSVHISRLYSSESPVVIELSMKDISKPFVRNIPRPRMRHRAPRITDVKHQEIQERRTPPMKIPLNEPRVNSPLIQGISVPKIPMAGPVPESSVAGTMGLAPMEAPPAYFTKKDYFDMMRMKIEGNKIYPEKARRLHQQGNVRVFFVIDSAGRVSSLKIVKPSKYPMLNQAALKAVEKSVPFPRPPSSLFKGDLKLELTIQFELR
ncbi:protein TonB [Desulfocicer vacuolatum DSM 3385]|uniref:Protein TonB n=1 Tax=Desulfocicer vacuolatum DSM 3385 TaxID=1121400 RepID=A0A1W2DDS1_9BACT|nr:energy transducer TonB [Desulfocicer vacuolatum]SMC95689.1 protein TonB [Desulfocicer vacuolatum DSM 3385]